MPSVWGPTYALKGRFGDRGATGHFWKAAGNAEQGHRAATGGPGMPDYGSSGVYQAATGTGRGEKIYL